MSSDEILPNMVMVVVCTDDLYIWLQHLLCDPCQPSNPYSIASVFSILTNTVSGTLNSKFDLIMNHIIYSYTIVKTSYYIYPKYVDTCTILNLKSVHLTKC